jgi:glyoxylase-like metal-dependent hydrolase (beta-lactamase superfamily II)
MTSHEQNAAPRRSVKPAAREAAPTELPPTGGTIEVRPGIHWARIALPMRLNHVNVWLLEDGAGWTLVDAGLDVPGTRDAFEAIFATTLGGRPVTRVVITHAHPDHVGIAGSVIRRFGATLHMTLVEWLYWRMRNLEALAGGRAESPEFYRLHGNGEAAAARMAAEQLTYTAFHADPPPNGFQRVQDGDTLLIGGRRWRAITAGGHAPEHLSLHCVEERLLIAGDQVLGRISPVIGVFPMMPEEDPLQAYLNSLRRFRALPAESFVLPSHGVPFAGLGARLDELEAHHAERLDAFVAAATQPMTAMELAARVFSAPVMAEAARLALFETVAHLNRLVRAGRLVRDADAEGVLRFLRAGSVSPARPGTG